LSENLCPQREPPANNRGDLNRNADAEGAGVTITTTDEPPNRPTNKAAKGALAAGVAAVLLLGGAGTLAFWSDSENVTGTPITSGELKLGTPACGTGWTLDGGTAFSTQKIVPGDVLTKVCTLDLIATGDHVGATLGISAGAFSASNALTGELTPAATFTVNGASTTTITEADDTGSAEIEATITVTYNGPAATNASQALTATLNTVAVTATQTHTP
jgi:alternate signal-mediated exported protein